MSFIYYGHLGIKLFDNFVPLTFDQTFFFSNSLYLLLLGFKQELSFIQIFSQLLYLLCKLSVCFLELIDEQIFTITVFDMSNKGLLCLLSQSIRNFELFLVVIPFLCDYVNEFAEFFILFVGKLKLLSNILQILLKPFKEGGCLAVAPDGLHLNLNSNCYYNYYMLVFFFSLHCLLSSTLIVLP